MADTKSEIESLRALARKHHGDPRAALAYSAANCLEILANEPNHPDREQVRSTLARITAALARPNP